MDTPCPTIQNSPVYQNCNIKAKNKSARMHENLQENEKRVESRKGEVFRFCSVNECKLWQTRPDTRNDKMHLHSGVQSRVFVNCRFILATTMDQDSQTIHENFGLRGNKL